MLSLQVNPTVTVGQIFQQIEADGRGIQNIIELQPPFAAVANRVLGSSVVTLTVSLRSPYGECLLHTGSAVRAHTTRTRPIRTCHALGRWTDGVAYLSPNCP